MAQYVNPGSLNRLAASLSFPDFPELNVINSSLGKGSIVWSPQGEATLGIQALTGVVQSPEPYQLVMIHADIVMTQPLCDAFISQIKSSTLLGNCVTRFATTNLSPETLLNSAIQSFNKIDSTGTVATVEFVIAGTWLINSSLYTG